MPAKISRVSKSRPKPAKKTAKKEPPPPVNTLPAPRPIALTPPAPSPAPAPVTPQTLPTLRTLQDWLALAQQQTAGLNLTA